MKTAKELFYEMLSENALKGEDVEKLSLTSGPAGVAVHDIVFETGKPALVGREMARVITTDKPSVIIPIGTLGAATWSTTEAFSDEDDQGQAYSYATISVNIFNRARQLWTKGFLEDAEWEVVAAQIGEIGRSIADKETEKVVAAFAASDGAGTIAIGNPCTMDNLTDLKALVDANDYKVDTFVLPPNLYAELLKDEKFTSSLYYDLDAPLRTGVHSVALGAKILVSSKCTADTIYAIDSTKAAVIVLRRDLEIREFEKEDTAEYGVWGIQRENVSLVIAGAFSKGTR